MQDKTKILNYARAEDAADASRLERFRSDHRVDLFLKGTGNVQHSRGYGAIIHLYSSPSERPPRRLMFRGGVKGESLPAASFRGVAECLDLLEALGCAGATVTVYTDSPNLMQALSGLAYRWREKGWKAASGAPTQNAEMIGRILDHMDRQFAVQAIYTLPAKSHELRLAETLSLTGWATAEEQRLEELAYVLSWPLSVAA